MKKPGWRNTLVTAQIFEYMFSDIWFITVIAFTMVMLDYVMSKTLHDDAFGINQILILSFD